MNFSNHYVNNIVRSDPSPLYFLLEKKIKKKSQILDFGHFSEAPLHWVNAVVPKLY